MKLENPLTSDVAISLACEEDDVVVTPEWHHHAVARVNVDGLCNNINTHVKSI